MFRISSKMKKILTITFLLLTLSDFAGAQTGILPSATQYEVNLNWQAPASSPYYTPTVGYFAFRALSPENSYYQLNEAAITTTSYLDASQLEYNSTYEYYVESVDAEGNTSVPSNTATVQIPFVPYAPVVGVISSS